MKLNPLREEGQVLVVRENKWIATKEVPIYLFYCKANIEDGKTVVVMQNNIKTFCQKVLFINITGAFCHQNAAAAAKKSGARNILEIVKGTIERIY